MKKDLFFCTDIDVLLDWILRDLAGNNEIFGLGREQFFLAGSAEPFRMRRYGRLLETPLGVASGPHTQMAQNIVAAWLTGSRYIELKTIQVLDELDVTKPCIDMTDEGYNCEWSQELKLDESFNEYLNAFVLLHILRDRLGLAGEEAGFIFNMSAGYELKGIHSPTVQRFFDRMENCSRELAEKIEKIAPIYPRIRELEIPARISDSLTISTMHGCPPDEIEKIARYFIEDRGYHTTIKLNPTLLGPERLRDILRNRLGYDIDVPDIAFAHDLKYPDAVNLIRTLQQSAADKGVSFNVKLTNTLETANIDQDLPKSEAMCYMSGRALHPISINLAARLQEEFDGNLDISFCAGVDTFNIVDTICCGLSPVTVCSDVLKPGGYARISQSAQTIRQAMKKAGADSLDALICRRAGMEDVRLASLANLRKYAEEVLASGRYAKDRFPYRSIKTGRSLSEFDCASAPCVTSCGAAQDVPRYMDYTARGRLDKAYRVILATNPFPNMQGMVCDHPCQSHCTRINYDAPLLIREIKRFVAENHGNEPVLTPRPANGRSVAIIGAGPAGLAAAFFLRLEGFSVAIYEARDHAGGMAAAAIPVFRLDRQALQRDIDRILALGVRLHTDVHIDRQKFEDLRTSHDFVFLGIGAQEGARLGIPGEESDGVFDHLDFLHAVNSGTPPAAGSRIIVIGGGNSAMDAARSARRLVDRDGEVTIVYRRTRRQMPADLEEVRDALAEGVNIVELAAPVAVRTEDGRVCGLEVTPMRLGRPDDSGRRSPIPDPARKTAVLPADSIIVAIGQRVVLDFLPEAGLRVNPQTLETGMKGMFAGGDVVRISSLINAIGHGRRAAEAIIGTCGLAPVHHLAPPDDRQPDLRALRLKAGQRQFGPAVPERPPGERIDFAPYVGTLSREDAMREASRCLQCDLVCNVCVTVCPNRANMALPTIPLRWPVQEIRPDGSLVRTGEAAISQACQVINVPDFCNECGNCRTFCPTSGAPYRDKPKVHLSEESLSAHGQGVFPAGDGTMLVMEEGRKGTLRDQGDTFFFEDHRLQVTIGRDTLAAESACLLEEITENISLAPITRAIVLHRLLEQHPLFGHHAR
ncbi:putative selenate reductase subunit YgfK [Thermodesulfobacteriota bacterium B35]